MKHIAFTDDKSFFCKQLQLPGVSLRFEHIDRAEKKGRTIPGYWQPKIGLGGFFLNDSSSASYRQKRSWNTASWHIHSVYTNLLSPTVMQWKIIIQGRLLPTNHRPRTISSPTWKQFMKSCFECRVTLMFSTTTRHGGPQFANLERQTNKKKTRWSYRPPKTCNQTKKNAKKLRKRQEKPRNHQEPPPVPEENRGKSMKQLLVAKKNQGKNCSIYC